MYKKNETQILRLKKNILYTIFHVTLFIVEEITCRKNKKK